MTTLMLDVDGVLVCGRPQDGAHLFTDLQQDLGISLADLQREFFVPRWEAIVTGQKLLMAELSDALAVIAPTVKAQTLVDYWFRNDSRIIPDVLQDVTSLRAQGHRVFLATNQEHMRARYLLSEMHLADNVDGIIYSADVGHRKPATEFFALATERAGALPSQIVFVDDTEANVLAARAFGWNAIHWHQGMSLAEAVRTFM